MAEAKRRVKFKEGRLEGALWAFRAAGAGAAGVVCLFLCTYAGECAEMEGRALGFWVERFTFAG